MAIGDPYATLAELKVWLGITDTNSDAELTSRLAAASRDVNRDCGRQFNKDAAPAARVYKPTHCGLVRVDDFYTTTGLVVKTDTDGDGVYETTWASTDYELYPLDGIVDGEPGWPFWKLKAVGPSLTFPIGGWWGLKRSATVQITASWGWNAVPEQIHDATLLRAGRLFRRKDSPEGVKGFSDLGVVRVARYDPDYDRLISRYVRRAVG